MRVVIVDNKFLKENPSSIVGTPRQELGKEELLL